MSAPSSQSLPSGTPPGRRTLAAYFGAGILAAAVPLLALAEKLAEHPRALQVFLDVLRQVGWPGLLVVVGALLLRQQAADHRAALQMVGEELAGAVRRLVDGLDGVRAEVKGLHDRLDATAVPRSGADPPGSPR